MQVHVHKIRVSEEYADKTGFYSVQCKRGSKIATTRASTGPPPLAPPHAFRTSCRTRTPRARTATTYKLDLVAI